MTECLAVVKIRPGHLPSGPTRKVGAVTSVSCLPAGLGSPRRPRSHQPGRTARLASRAAAAAARGES